ncbi:MAG: hypothetical protein KGH64_05415 [Candidatus Micrarchaeota archaeon]|nr:hypothetical protein [Candidatus Micrarchaeota archaeon]
MFKSGKVYNGLDDYFHTTIEQDHLRSNKHIKERVEQVESLYEDWPYDPFWKHANDSSNWKNAFCMDTINLMAESASCYALGFFKTAVVAASAAVEQLIHVDVPFNSKRVKIANNMEYLLADYGAIGAALPKAKKLGYPTGLLLDAKENDLQRCIFVQRRNMVAHGVHENQFIIEQVHYANVIDTLTDKSNEEYLYFNGASAFDQYKKASRFVITTFRWFDKERKPSKSGSGIPTQ